MTDKRSLIMFANVWTASETRRRSVRIYWPATRVLENIRNEFLNSLFVHFFCFYLFCFFFLLFFGDESFRRKGKFETKPTFDVRELRNVVAATYQWEFNYVYLFTVMTVTSAIYKITREDTRTVRYPRRG